ncbi:MAG: hypothetical protein JRI84_00545 [Deltaproteobacteria bacterium]|nr:hypothetical protein [Deltaproteobacteria bacterium]
MGSFIDQGFQLSKKFAKVCTSSLDFGRVKSSFKLFGGKAETPQGRFQVRNNRWVYNKRHVLLFLILGKNRYFFKKV